MRIFINGQPHEAAPGQTLLGLVTSLGLDPAVVVAELNQAIVPGERFTDTGLHEGDRLELLSFVGGG